MWYDYLPKDITPKNRMIFASCTTSSSSSSSSFSFSSSSSSSSSSLKPMWPRQVLPELPWTRFKVSDSQVSYAICPCKHCQMLGHHIAKVRFSNSACWVKTFSDSQCCDVHSRSTSCFVSSGAISSHATRAESSVLTSRSVRSAILGQAASQEVFRQHGPDAGHCRHATRAQLGQVMA